MKVWWKSGGSDRQKQRRHRLPMTKSVNLAAGPSVRELVV
jgi:hypothetical protein